MGNDSLSSLYKELLFGGWSLVARFNLLKTIDYGRKYE